MKVPLVNYTPLPRPPYLANIFHQILILLQTNWSVRRQLGSFITVSLVLSCSLACIHRGMRGYALIYSWTNTTENLQFTPPSPIFAWIIDSPYRYLAWNRRGRSPSYARESTCKRSRLYLVMRSSRSFLSHERLGVKQSNPILSRGYDWRKNNPMPRRYTVYASASS